ncbi:DUF6473 family protein [Acuticoccus yangtzensis]|uniref:DUF6473 family protein n=1 Tax=Acuticoccus yangtzensis TaxID=1443441 RepID=UPI0009495AD7|nr:DUF6473 family protein [Acuticoccus yangtzensis]
MGNEAYQERDAAFFDYKLFERFDLQLRGPQWPVDEPADLNIVGSARVFGRFVERPLSTVLSEDYGIRARNLGTAGGNPFMYLKRPSLLHYLATSDAVPIFQVCGADGHSNDWFTRITGRTMRVKTDALGLGLTAGTNVRGGVGYRKAFKTQPFEAVVEQIHKGQDFVLEEYKELKRALGRPAVIMYFSDRPARPLTKDSYRDIFSFPHCVDRRMWENLKDVFEYSLEIVSNEGMPYEVTDGKETVAVDLYPSVAMHRTAAAEIARHADAIRALATGTPKPLGERRVPLPAADDEPAPRARRQRPDGTARRGGGARRDGAAAGREGAPGGGDAVGRAHAARADAAEKVDGGRRRDGARRNDTTKREGGVRREDGAVRASGEGRRARKAEADGDGTLRRSIEERRSAALAARRAKRAAASKPVAE